jgi:hypothetical protein
MTKPNNYRPLLTVGKDAKTPKGEKLGYLTGIMYLAPASSSKVTNVCPMSTAGCRKACLNTAGMAGIFPQILKGRTNKTKFMVKNPKAFRDSLRYDINKLVVKAERKNMIPAVRLNGTSDLPKLAIQLANEFPTVQFYDYTKIPKPYNRTLPNYYVTFSLSESNLLEALDVLKHGMNVAVVFNRIKGEPLPNDWHGFKVVDGDISDLRFLDEQGVVVGLRAKGKAKKDTSGFVQIAGI